MMAYSPQGSFVRWPGFRRGPVEPGVLQLQGLEDDWLEDTVEELANAAHTEQRVLVGIMVLDAVAQYL